MPGSSFTGPRALLLAGLAALAAAYTVDPPAPAASDTVQDCTNWWVVASGDTCQSIADGNGITLDQFNTYNPSTRSACKLVVGNAYCVEENWGIPVPTSTTSTTTSTSATPTNGITTPSPIQDGMTPNCNKFYDVKSGDGCYDIAAANKIALSDFYAWNPAIGNTCASLWPDYYVCVGVLGSTTTSTPTTPTNGVTTPTPTQSGMVSNCNKFYDVKSGDGCSNIASANGISLANFYAWNPAVKTDCSGLWPDYYVCVGLIGGSGPTTTTPTTTTPTNGISTPTPTQSGMVSSCNKFYYVKSGDGCSAIATSYGISLSQFYTWNPAIGNTCANLWPDYYVCVSVIGFTPSTTLKPTTTSGNGIATPTPIQTGMVTNCKKFYDVKSGDGCYDIAQTYSITLANFYAWNPAVKTDCSGLWPDYYVCVGV